MKKRDLKRYIENMVAVNETIIESLEFKDSKGCDWLEGFNKGQICAMKGCNANLLRYIKLADVEYDAEQGSFTGEKNNQTIEKEFSE